jgi:hypothetical protein
MAENIPLIISGLSSSALGPKTIYIYQKREVKSESLLGLSRTDFVLTL